MNKKKMYNEKKRCYHCGGTLASVSGFGDHISLPIMDDKIIIRYVYWVNTPDGKGENQWEDLEKIDINFCPYCGCQLRKKVDWSLCD